MRSRSEHEPNASISQLTNAEDCSFHTTQTTLNQQCWSGRLKFYAERLGGFLIRPLVWLPA